MISNFHHHECSPARHQREFYIPYPTVLRTKYPSLEEKYGNWMGERNRWGRKYVSHSLLLISRIVKTSADVRKSTRNSSTHSQEGNSWCPTNRYGMVKSEMREEEKEDCRKILSNWGILSHLRFERPFFALSHLREGKSLLLNYAIDLPPLLCSCLRHCENPVYAVCFPILQHRSLRRQGWRVVS